MLRRIVNALAAAPKKILILCIKAYRFFLSPLLGPRCRFYPSCSQYAQSALEEQGVFRGVFLIVKRLLRCHPFHPGGYDPVPTHNQR